MENHRERDRFEALIRENENLKTENASLKVTTFATLWNDFTSKTLTIISNFFLM
jgi:hypothetical protein